ncbi:MAG: hypothetical protein AB7O21_19610 [Gammaproteobacteria bacterium]
MNIKSAKRVPWVPGDCEWIDGATVIGRVRIEPKDGGLVHALLLEKNGEQRAVFLDRVRGTFDLCQADAFDD